MFSRVATMRMNAVETVSVVSFMEGVQAFRRSGVGC
jgi:hypothetical protein